MRKLWILGLLLCLLAACGGQPTPTPDLVATQVAVERSAHATLTAEALASAPTLAPTLPPTAAPPPTAVPTSTQVKETAPAPSPTATRFLPPTPTATTLPPTPRPTETLPPVRYRPDPYAVVGVAPDDSLNVRTGPGVSYAVAGAIPAYGQGVRAGETGVEVDGSLWLPVWYEGVAGWVNSSYLARQVGLIDQEVAARAVEIITALKNKDLDELAVLAHPDKGVRFSPYTYVQTEEDLVFSPDQIPNALADPTVYTWGAFDGSGEPIQFTFQQYFDRFVYDVDFAQPHAVGLDQVIGRGNTINNIAEVYPQAVVIEYHFEGFDPAYSGMDWRSLRLVLEEKGGVWFLVGIVHDEWTI